MTVDVTNLSHPNKAALGLISDMDYVEAGKPCYLPSVFTFDLVDDGVQYWKDFARTSVVCEVLQDDWIYIIQTLNTYYVVLECNEYTDRVYHYALVETEPKEGEFIWVTMEVKKVFLTKTYSKKVKVEKVWDKLKEFGVYIFENGKDVYMVYKRY